MASATVTDAARCDDLKIPARGNVELQYDSLGQLLRVARLLAAPGRHAESTDLYPTIRDMAGAPGNSRQDHQLEGHSLTSLLQETNASLDRESLYFHYPHYYPTTSPVSAVRAGDWKLLQYYEDEHVELYNLADDLGETTDLSAEMPDRTATLLRRLVAWRDSVWAQLPTLNTERAD